MMRITFYLLLIGWLLSGCGLLGDDCSSRLAEAERIMDERPDSALCVLESIRQESISSRRLKALYALLKSQALDKNYVDVDSDSLTACAVDYFDGQTDKRRAAVANYYHGRVKENAGMFSGAILAYLDAIKFASECDDCFWIAMSARGISTIYQNNYNAVEGVRYAEIALENFRRTGKAKYIDQAVFKLASAHHSNKDYEISIRLCRELLDSIAVRADSVLFDNVTELLGLSYMAVKDFRNSRDCYERLCRSLRATGVDSCYLGILSVRIGDVDKGRKLLASLSRSKTISPRKFRYIEYEVCAALGETARAYELYKEISHDNDSILSSACRQNLSGAIIEYHDIKSAADLAELQMARLRLWAVVGGGGILLAVGCVVVRRRQQRQRLLIGKYVDMIRDMREIIRENESRIADFRAAHVDSGSRLAMFENHFVELDNLFKIYGGDDSTLIQKKFNDSMARLIESYASDKDKIKELEMYVNYCYDGLMTKLRADFPKIKEIDCRLVLFSRLGFSNVAISLLLKENNMMSIYNRRKRLKTKFSSFEGENSKKYLEAIS